MSHLGLGKGPWHPRNTILGLSGCFETFTSFCGRGRVSKHAGSNCGFADHKFSVLMKEYPNYAGQILRLLCQPQKKCRLSLIQPLTYGVHEKGILVCRSWASGANEIMQGLGFGCQDCGLSMVRKL